ncbi:hypothetical protein HK100_001061 [Physocladia obscura]|uniref:3'-phosphate/5'-hydroxy nucleic acid ligase n=1 Tax=Physocladia obscura TaxID=109957 RepID=A0AAD5XBB6_9FUNG|nr:hypothetical protein HK100_001061 [Physocladia obscura]
METTTNRRVTVVSNVNQTTRTVAILRSGKEVAQIHLIAKNKLRMKKPQRIFDASGHELTTTLDYSTIYNDALIYVSSGEAFIGVIRPDTNQHGADTNTAAEVVLLADAAFVDNDALSQLKHTATLTGVVRAVGYPDLCPGLRFPVGAAFLVRDRVYPELIGGDIGCGMTLYRLNLNANFQVEKVANRLKSLDKEWHGDKESFLCANGLMPSNHDVQLGTIGGGNHFAELQVVHQVVDQSVFEQMGLKSNDVVLLVHSGSRSLGKSVLDRVLSSSGDKRVKDGVCYLENSPDFNSYMESHDTACVWARCNRELIAQRFCAMLTAQDETLVSSKWMQTIATKLIDIHHNHVELRSERDGEKIWVHRKGAAPSDRGVVPVPGSRGAFTYLVRPRGDQYGNAFSLPHGAGRKWTRNKANATVSEKYKGSMVNVLSKTDLGSTVICEDRNLLAEEAPEAYKDIQDVVSDISNIVDVIAIMKPILTYKFRRE